MASGNTNDLLDVSGIEFLSL